ncbi:MAG: glycosyltransferase family 87 protein [Elusimicrobiota bacterium]
MNASDVNKNVREKGRAKKNSFPFWLGIVIALISLITFFGYSVREFPKTLNGTDPEDYPNYYFPAQRLFSGEAMYEDLKKDVYEELGWEYDLYPSIPPTGIIFVSPLSLFPYKVSWIMFAVFSVLLLLGLLTFTAREMGYSKKLSVIISIIFLGSAPFLFLLKRNHMEMWIVLFGVLGWYKLRNKKNFTGNFLWGIAGSLKLFPFLWFAVTGHRDKKNFLKAAIATVGLLLISFYIIGFREVLYYITDIIPRSQLWYGKIGNYSIISLSYALNISKWGWTLAVILGGIVFYPRLWTGPVDDLFNKSVSLSLLLSPLSWINYQVLLFPCLIILSRYIPFEKKYPRWSFFLICIVIWGWPADLNIVSSSSFNILLSSMPPVLSTLGIFVLSHIYIYRGGNS